MLQSRMAGLFKTETFGLMDIGRKMEVCFAISKRRHSYCDTLSNLNMVHCEMKEREKTSIS